MMMMGITPIRVSGVTTAMTTTLEQIHAKLAIIGLSCKAREWPP
jgi:hypothetical protein